MELVGTFALIYVSCMLSFQGLTLYEQAIALTMVVSVFSWVGHSVSGSHYNPALTVAMIITQKVKPLDGLIYIIV